MRSSLPLPKLERHYFRASDGERIAYYVAGRPEAPLLLISAGLGGGVRAWAGIIARLMHQFRIVAWDYRGLYASVNGRPPPSHRLTIASHASDLRDLILHLELSRDQAPILAGWSMGVQVNFELARTHGEHLKAIVALHGAAGGILSTAFDSLAFERASPKIFRAMRRHHQRFRGPARYFARSRRVAMAFMAMCQRLGIMDTAADPDMFHDMARDWVGLDLATYATIFEHLGAHDARDVLPSLELPILVVAGDADRFTPLHRSEEMMVLLPNATLLVVPGATHFGPLEHPGIIAAAIVRFAHERDLVDAALLEER